MSANKLILLGSLLLGSVSIAGFSGAFNTIQTMAENTIEKEDAWNNIVGKTYFCEEKQSTLTVAGDTVTDGSFNFTFSDGVTSPVTVQLSSLPMYSADETKISFLTWGGIKIEFALDYNSVEVVNNGHKETEGTYTIVLPTPNEEKLSTGAIVGISVGAVAGVSLITYATMFGIFVKTKKGPKFLIKSFEGILKLFKK